MEGDETKRRLELMRGTLDMLILRTLMPGPAHGHEIAKHIQRTTEDFLQVEHGSLYPALHRLEKRGWLKADWRPSETGRVAKFYSLTRVGRKRLGAETANWDRLAGAVDLILRTAE